MTDDDLMDDLCRLVRDGLVLIECDQRDAWEEDPASRPRFYLTARGQVARTAGATGCGGGAPSRGRDTSGLGSQESLTPRPVAAQQDRSHR